MGFAVGLVLVGTFQGRFTSGRVGLAIVEVVDGTAYVNRRPHVGAFDAFLNSVLGVPRATCRPRGRFQYEECFEVEGGSSAGNFQVGIVIGRRFTYQELDRYVHRHVGAERYVRVRATSRVHLVRRLVNGFDVFVMPSCVLNSQRPSRGVQGDVKGGSVRHLFL